MFRGVEVCCVSLGATRAPPPVRWKVLFRRCGSVAHDMPRSSPYIVPFPMRRERACQHGGRLHGRRGRPNRVRRPNLIWVFNHTAIAMRPSISGPTFIWIDRYFSTNVLSRSEPPTAGVCHGAATRAKLRQAPKLFPPSSFRSGAGVSPLAQHRLRATTPQCPPLSRS